MIVLIVCLVIFLVTIDNMTLMAMLDSWYRCSYSTLSME